MIERYLTLDEAAARIGVHRATISRKLLRGELVGYLGADRRRRYVRESDLDRLAAPTPIVRPQEPAEMPRLAS